MLLLREMRQNHQLGWTGIEPLHVSYLDWEIQGLGAERCISAKITWPQKAERGSMVVKMLDGKKGFGSLGRY